MRRGLQRKQNIILSFENNLAVKIANKANNAPGADIELESNSDGFNAIQYLVHILNVIPYRTLQV